MSQRTVLRPETLTSIDMSLSSTASQVTILQGLSILNYAVSWTGTSPVGTLSLQFSDDYRISSNGQTVVTAGTWNTAPIDVNGAIATSAAVSGNTGNGMFDIELAGAYAARLLYTRVSGTGTLIPVVTGKVA